MTSPDAAEADDGQPWQQTRSVLARLLDGLEFGEVIELAAAGSFYLEVGRVPGAIWLLASGPPNTALTAGQLEGPLRKRLRGLGFRAPDKEKPSWWYAVELPAEPADLEQAADQAVSALQQVEGVSSPGDLVWSHIVAGPETRATAAELGIPRSPSQNS